LLLEAYEGQIGIILSPTRLPIPPPGHIESAMQDTTIGVTCSKWNRKNFTNWTKLLLSLYYSLRNLVLGNPDGSQ